MKVFKVRAMQTLSMGRRSVLFCCAVAQLALACSASTVATTSPTR